MLQRRDLERVGSRFGAPMGRNTDKPLSAAPWTSEPWFCYRVPLDRGGYDRGGAYWGHHKSLYFIQTENGDYLFSVRAVSRQEAQAEAEAFANAKIKWARS